MKTVVLAPHNDDECLFAGYLVQKYRADVVVVLKGRVQGLRGAPITWEERARESLRAVSILRPGWPEEPEPTAPMLSQWRFSDADPDWDDIAIAVRHLSDLYDCLLAPAWEPGGHTHHNKVAEIAAGTWPADRVGRYLTYTPAGRSVPSPDNPGFVTVDPEPEWIVRKLAALACYRTQIHEPTCRPHFLRPLDEYALPPAVGP